MDIKAGNSCRTVVVFQYGTHDRVVASRANDRLAGIHRKGGGAIDCCGYHIDIYRDNRPADCLW